METALRDFERRLLDAAIEGDAEQEILRAQVAAALVSSREHTGVGLYVNLDVQRAPKLRSPRVDRQLEGAKRILLSHPALDYGAGAIVWVDDGRIQSIECFAYHGSWPDDEAAFRTTIQPADAGEGSPA